MAEPSTSKTEEQVIKHNIISRFDFQDLLYSVDDKASNVEVQE